MKKGISENVPHTYIQNGIRYYALMCFCTAEGAAGQKVSAVNFYVFDQEGYAFLQVIHTTRAFIYSLGNGILRHRSVLEVSPTDWVTGPIVEPDDVWVNGSADRGYALEVIREALGLNLTYLTALMDTDLEPQKMEGNYEKTEAEPPR